MTSPNETFQLLNAYHDGELSPRETLEMERRLEAEPELRVAADRIASLSGKVGKALAATPVPPTLRGRVVQQLGFADVTPRRRWSKPFQSLAASLLVAALGGGVIGSGATYFAVGRGDESGQEQSILAGHLRALEAPQPFDIASSNRHVVKPWFNGKTSIAPQVIDLADQGFPLIGGRIDIVNGKPVPTMVYRGGPHTISVTVVPRTGGRDFKSSQAGYAIAHWTQGDLTYWVVSDIDPASFERFETLLRTQVAEAG